MNALDKIIGMSVIEINIENGYLQVFLSNNFCLNVFNLFDFSCKSFSVLKGKEVMNIQQEKYFVKIFFKGGDFLKVGLKDSDFQGPEAMVLYEKGQSPIVWS